MSAKAENLGHWPASVPPLPREPVGVLTTDRLVEVAHVADAPLDGSGRLIPIASRPMHELDRLARISRAIESEVRASMAPDIELLAWVLTHPHAAAEELENAARGIGDARTNLEDRKHTTQAARALPASPGGAL